MTVSIIIPNFNQARYLEKTLEALQSQILLNGIKSEIIVVDNESTDHSIDIAKKFGCTVLINREEKNPYLSRNLAVEYSKAEFLAFLDSKSVPAKNWLKKSIESLIKNANQIIVGKIDIWTSSKPSFEELAYKIMYLDNEYSYAMKGTYPAQNFFLSKSLFTKIGPFNTIRSGSDNEWFERARNLQVPIILNPEIKVESTTKTKHEFYTDIQRMGKGARQNWVEKKGLFKTNLVALSYFSPMSIDTFNEKLKRRKLNLTFVQKLQVWTVIWKARKLFGFKMLGF